MARENVDDGVGDTPLSAAGARDRGQPFPRWEQSLALKTPVSEGSK